MSLLSSLTTLYFDLNCVSGRWKTLLPAQYELKLPMTFCGDILKVFFCHYIQSCGHCGLNFVTNYPHFYEGSDNT